MSKVVNEPKSRIRWLKPYVSFWSTGRSGFICFSVTKQGRRALPQDFAPAAIRRRCGHMQGRQLVKGRTKSLKGLAQNPCLPNRHSLFWNEDSEMHGYNELEIHFHYCPLVKGMAEGGLQWWGDRLPVWYTPCAVTEGSGRPTAAPWNPKLKTIANGDDICHLRYYRKNAMKEQ